MSIVNDVSLKAAVSQIGELTAPRIPVFTFRINEDPDDVVAMTGNAYNISSYETDFDSEPGKRWVQPNLLTGTSTWTGAKDKATPGTILSQSYNENKILEVNGSWAGKYYVFNAQAGKRYTFSADVFMNGNNDMQFNINPNSWGQADITSGVAGVKTSTMVSGKWFRPYVIFDCIVSGKTVVCIESKQNVTGLKIAGYKVEEGGNENPVYSKSLSETPEGRSPLEVVSRVVVEMGDKVIADVVRGIPLRLNSDGELQPNDFKFAFTYKGYSFEANIKVSDKTILISESKGLNMEMAAMVCGISTSQLSQGQEDYLNYVTEWNGTNKTRTDSMAFVGDAAIFRFTPPNFIIHKDSQPVLFKNLMTCLDGARLRRIGISSVIASKTYLHYFEIERIVGTVIYLRSFWDETNETWIKGVIAYRKEPNYDEEETRYEEYFEFRFLQESVNVRAVLTINHIGSITQSPLIIGNGDMQVESDGISWKNRPGHFSADVSWDIVEMFNNARELVFFNEAAFPTMNDRGSKVRCAVKRKDIYNNGTKMILHCAPMITEDGELWKLTVDMPVVSKMDTLAGRITGEWDKLGSF